MKKLQLFLLPYAGGNSVSFRNLVPFLDTRIDIIAVEYAGRMTRREEAFIGSYANFIKDVENYIRKNRNYKIPYAIFGYSMGSVLTYDLLSQNMLMEHPVHAFICAKGSLFYGNEGYYSELSEEDFVNEIKTLGGIDERILQNKRFCSIYLEPIKADYMISEQFCFKAGEIPCDATVIYSRKDPVARGIYDWNKLVTGTVDFYEMGSNHFFIYQNWQKVAEIVNCHLEKYLD